MKKRIFLGFFLMAIVTSLTIAEPTVDSVIREYNSLATDIENFTNQFKRNPEKWADTAKTKMINLNQKMANLSSETNYVVSSGVTVTKQQEDNLRKANLRVERACNNLNAAFQQYVNSNL